MRGEAKLCIFGHVGADPKSPSERNPDFITFSLAVTESWKDRNGSKQSRTDWYEVLTSQKGLSGLIRNHVRKGNPVYIEGSPKYGEYKNRDGETRFRVEINLTKLVFLGSKTDGNNISAETEKSRPEYELSEGERYEYSSPQTDQNSVNNDIPF